MEDKNIRLIAFDLDGTLTQHKEPLSIKTRAILDRLSEKYQLLMVGAGAVDRIFRQMREYPIDIIGNYGLQYAEYERESKKIQLIKNQKFDVDQCLIEKRVTELRERFDYARYTGKSVEFHESGCITIPLLGTEAKQADKLAFDPDRRKRRAIYQKVVEMFPEYLVFVGGSSSFDMAPKPFDKYYALKCYCKEHGLEHDQVVFVGDDYGLGGNDESVYQSDFHFICVDDYRKFPELVKELL